MWAWILLAYVIYRLIKGLAQALGTQSAEPEESAEDLDEKQEEGLSPDLVPDFEALADAGLGTDKVIEGAVDRFHEDHEDFKAYLDAHAKALLDGQEQTELLSSGASQRRPSPKHRPDKKKIRQGLKWQVLLSPPPSSWHKK